MVMISKEIKFLLLFLVSFFIAFSLVFLRIPDWSKLAYPQWLQVIILYWAFVMPNRINIGIACLAGFFLDIAYNTPIGENAFALIIATYFIIRFSREIKELFFWKKAIIIFGIITCCQILPVLLQICLDIDKHADFCFVFSQSVTSTIVWLAIYLLFNNHKQKFHFEKHY